MWENAHVCIENPKASRALDLGLKLLALLHQQLAPPPPTPQNHGYVTIMLKHNDFMVVNQSCGRT